MRHLFPWIAIASLILCGGNALAADVRQDTKVIGLYIQSVKQTAEMFKLHRDLIATGAVRNTNLLEENALRSEQAVQKEISIWKITEDKDRISLFESLRTTADKVLEQRHALEAQQKEHNKLLKEAKSAVDFHIDKLAEAASTLANLAEQKSTAEQAKFYVDFIRQIRSDIKENSQKQAEAVSQSAVQNLSQKQ